MSNLITQPEYNGESFEDLALRTIMKRQGVDSDEAHLIVEAMKKKGELEPLAKWMSTLGAYSDTLSRMPPASQRDFSAMIMSKALMEDSGGKQDWLEKIVALKEVGILGESGSNKKIEALEKEILSLKESEQKRMFDDYKKFMEDKLAAVEAKIGSTGQNAPQETDSVKKLASELNELNEKQKIINQITGNVGHAGFNAVEAATQLANLGYKVEGPVTPAQIEQMVRKMQIDFEEKLATEKRKAIEEEKEKSKNTQQTIDMGLNAMGVIIDSIAMFLPDAAKQSGAKIGDVIKRARQVGAGVAAPTTTAQV